MCQGSHSVALDQTIGALCGLGQAAGGFHLGLRGTGHHEVFLTFLGNQLRRDDDQLAAENRIAGLTKHN